jgi:hypothetical protein
MTVLCHSRVGLVMVRQETVKIRIEKVKKTPDETSGVQKSGLRLREDSPPGDPGTTFAGCGASSGGSALAMDCH